MYISNRSDFESDDLNIADFHVLKHRKCACIRILKESEVRGKLDATDDGGHPSMRLKLQ
jgi:hypothetical protein